MLDRQRKTPGRDERLPLGFEIVFVNGVGKYMLPTTSKRRLGICYCCMLRVCWVQEWCRRRQPGIGSRMSEGGATPPGKTGGRAARGAASAASFGSGG